LITILELNNPQAIEWQTGIAKEDYNGIRTFYNTDHQGNTRVTCTTNITSPVNQIITIGIWKINLYICRNSSFLEIDPNSHPDIATTDLEC
jgi:hypothetical protein